MRVQYVELYNWTSYWNAPYGEDGSAPHLFSFNSESGRNGYAIFGENSRGKSSFSDAIEWALYGEAWTKPISADGRVQKRTLRPLVGHPDEQREPLLNTHSFRAGNYSFHVSITFEKDGDTIKVTRMASANEEGASVRGDGDMGVTLMVKNYTKDTEIFGADAEEFVRNQILPRNLTRFFFIDGESITEYRAMISSKEENTTIRKNIEDILNFPVLKKGLTDIQHVKGQFMERLTEIKNKTKRQRRLADRISEKDSEIKKKRKMVEATEKKREEAEGKLISLEAMIGEFASSETLMGEKSGLLRVMKSARGSLQRAHSDRRSSNRSLWLVLLQESVESAVEELGPEIKRFEDRQQHISELRSSISFLEGMGERENEPCPTCNQLPRPRDEGKKLEDEDEIARKTAELDGLLEEGGDGSEAQSAKNKLGEFRIGALEGVLSSNHSEINRLMGEIESLEAEMEGIEKALDDIDEEEISRLRKDIKSASDKVAEHSSRERRYKNELDVLTSEKSKLLRDLGGTEGSDELIRINSKIEAAEYLERMWGEVLDSYSQNIRVEVERLATETFLKLTNNPDGYSSISLNERFGLTVLDSEGHPVQAPTPGLMQVTAISLIDALGERSNIKFPIFFDTPGQSIDQGHRENIVNHYWSERDMQFVIIPSSGEFRANEVEEKYEHLIARTWELDFDDKTNKTKVIDRMWN